MISYPDLMELNHRIQVHLVHHLTDLGLPPQRLLVLRRLHYSSVPLTMTQLGKTYLSVAKTRGNPSAAATSFVDQCERRGLLIRSRDKEDRRKVYVNITQKGRKLVEQVDSIVKAFVQSQIDLASHPFTQVQLTSSETDTPSLENSEEGLGKPGPCSKFEE